MPLGDIRVTAAKWAAEDDEFGYQRWRQSHRARRGEHEVHAHERPKSTSILTRSVEHPPDARASFKKREKYEQRVHVIDVDHQRCRQAEECPARQRQSATRAIPIPDEEPDSEGGLHVGPRRKHVEIRRKGTREPNANRREQRPLGFGVPAGEAERKDQREESVYGRADCHRVDVGF